MFGVGSDVFVLDVLNFKLIAGQEQVLFLLVYMTYMFIVLSYLI